MPFQSYAQAAYLKHNHPNIYAKWVKEHGKEPIHKTLHVKEKQLRKGISRLAKRKKHG